ncbi:MAG: heavy metal-associated domain-containing protein [Bacteroidota bacterium]
METHIKVDNLKCGGCANTIEKILGKISGVDKVDVLVDNDEIILHHFANINIDSIKKTLKKLGYPETGTTKGIEKAAENIKSYVSCAIGKLSDTKKSDKES